jgi:hypothetical protein
MGIFSQELSGQDMNAKNGWSCNSIPPYDIMARIGTSLTLAGV